MYVFEMGSLCTGCRTDNQYTSIHKIREEIVKQYPVKAISLAVAAAACMQAPTVFAQEEAALEEIITVGTRVAGRSATQSVAPVDVISSESLTNRGDGDMSNILRAAIPSYNVNDQPISDAATIVRPANLRGLAPDQTLIMVNGKRRHRAAVISFLGGGLSDGAQGADVATIPAIALERVEVLRDGAAAQYGSDAIAGVINFVLKSDTDGGAVEMKLGSTYKGDGDKLMFAANKGLDLGNGFVNVSMEYGSANPTSRSVQRDDAAALIAAGRPVNDPAQVWGLPEVNDDLKLFVNTGVEMADGDEVYAFGSYAEREVEGGFFFRNPDNRGGVFTSGGNYLIADLDLTDGVTCPTIAAGDHAGIDSLPAGCWSFHEMFPGGFTPKFGGNVNDIAGVLGMRGTFWSDVNYDVSFGAGRNEAEFFMKNTVNASLGPDTPTEFTPGTYVQLEKNFNVDLSKSFDTVIGEWNIAGGFEWRDEIFEAKIGDKASWEIGEYSQQGFSVGSNGFPGFGPDVAGKWNRDNIAVYLDAEGQVTDKLIFGAAIRHEKYDDYDQDIGKLSARYDFTDNFAIRTTASTGFRAPTPGQANVINVSTVFEPDPNNPGGLILANRATLSPAFAGLINPAATLLQPETSKSFSIGMVAAFGDVDVTIDAYNIEVDERIAQSETFNVSDADRQILKDAGFPGADDMASYRFFTNDFDTETNGVDVVATMPLALTSCCEGDISFIYNYNKTEVKDSQLLSDARIKQLEENLPRHRANISLTQSWGNWNAGARVSYYGEFFEDHLDSNLPIDVGSEVITDIELGYTFDGGMQVIVGADNVFDVYPQDNVDWDTEGAGAKYPLTAPYGFQGGYYYLRARYQF